MNYGTAQAEYVVTLAYSAKGMLKGGTRSHVIIFKDVDTGEEIDLGEQMSEALMNIIQSKKKG